MIMTYNDAIQWLALNEGPKWDQSSIYDLADQPTIQLISFIYRKPVREVLVDYHYYRRHNS